MSIFESQKMSEVVDVSDSEMSMVWQPSDRESGNQEEYDYPPVLISSHDGRLTNTISEMIDSAKQTIIVCSFLLADQTVEDALYAAANRGIRVYLMLACETRLENDNPDDDFGKKCHAQHLSMLERLAGKVMIRSAPYFHAKTLLIDAIGQDTFEPKGILLTANVTSEALTRNEELAVVLSEEEIKEQVSIFKWAFFEYAKHEMTDNQDFKSIEPLEEIPYPTDLVHILSTNSESRSIQDHLLEIIKQAKNELLIASFGWQADHPVVEAVCEKAKQGVNVTVLCRMRPAAMPALIKLKEAGAEVYGFKWLHAKAVCADSEQAMIMSANLEKHGLDEGFEIGIKLTDNKAVCLRNALSGFLKKPHWVFKLTERLGNLLGDIQRWDKDKKEFSYLTIEKSKTVTLSDVETPCDSDSPQKPAIPQNNDPHCHKIVFEWTVKPMQLPSGAIEQFREETKVVEEKNKKGKPTQKKVTEKHPYSPRVYKQKDHVFIAISGRDQFHQAVSLKASTFSQAKIVLKK